MRERRRSRTATLHSLSGEVVIQLADSLRFSHLATPLPVSLCRILTICRTQGRKERREGVPVGVADARNARRSGRQGEVAEWLKAAVC